MDERISLSEIKKKYDGEWVLLQDPETDESLKIKGGEILWHSSDRDEVYQKARELKPEHSAILYAGKMAKDAVIVL